VAAAGVLLAVGTMLAARVSFDSDITRMDGVSPAVRQGEKDFQRTWGRSDTEMAILVVTGKTRDDAEQLNDKINGLMAGKITQGRYLSLSAFWPSAATRHASLVRWRQYWSDQRVADLRRKLATAGAPLDFSARAFEPFFQSLASPPQEETSRQILSSIEEQFIARSGSDWQMLNYFEDTPENVVAAAALAHDFPDAQVVSRSAISDAFAKSAVSETNLLVSISVVFIVGSLLLLTRSAIKSLIMMLPAITGIIGMLAVMAMMSMTISVITVVAGIFVLALASDYGIFAVFAWDRGESLFGQGMASVHLSSVTTLVGSGALLLALHPATFLVGVSLTSGLLVGYLTAFLVIPGICFLLERRKQRRAM
jgi:predicted exporter